MDVELAIYRRLPDPITCIERSHDLSDSTKARYLDELGRYLEIGGDPFDANQLLSYASGVSDTARSFLSAAINRWADDTVRYVKSLATPDNMSAVQAVVYRIEAVKGAIKPAKREDESLHRWLSQAQVRQMFSYCPDDVVGDRDRAALGLMVGAGLRREEAVTLPYEQIKVAPVGNKERTVLNVLGKGKKKRSVPVSEALSNAIHRWGRWLDYEGLVLRSLGNNQEIRESMSAVALFNLIRKYGEYVGISDLASHDLRRTFAQLGYEAGVPIGQISKLLGHSSINTTQRYLNLDLDLEHTVSDFIPIY